MGQILGMEDCSLFAIWLVSDGLELQVPGHNIPHKVLNNWPKLYLSYGHKTIQEKEKDANRRKSLKGRKSPETRERRKSICNDLQPARLMFRLGCPHKKKAEHNVKDPIAIDLLYKEARENVLVYVTLSC